MRHTPFSRNRVAPRFYHLVWPLVGARRSFAAALASVWLTVLPALAGGVPNAEPAPSAKDKEPPGVLVIVGGGDLPDAIRDRFLELAGGKKGKLVVIPTASEQAERRHVFLSYDYWCTQGLASVKMLHTLDQKEANDPSFVKPLTEATAAWLGGGDQTRLAKAYHGTAVERELRRLVARGGVIGGTSAGASVMSSIMITGGNPQARVGEGFGLLPDVVIDQHFRNRKRQQRLLSVLEKHPRCLGLGIDEETAVVVSGHTFTVLGKANVSVCLPPIGGDETSVKLLKSGEDGDLLQLSNRILARFKTSTDSKSVASKSSRATTP